MCCQRGRLRTCISIHAVPDLLRAVAETQPMSDTVRTVGSSADTDSRVAAMAMLLALPSDDARKCPSHVSLNVVSAVAHTCARRKSRRDTTWNLSLIHI